MRPRTLAAMSAEGLRPSHAPPAPLWSVLAISALGSLGSGVMWNGIAFVTKQDFGYSELQSFALLLATGLIYVVGAFTAGKITRAVEHRLSTRGVLGVIFLIQAAVSSLLVIPGTPWLLWLAACVGSACAAIQWPIIESYVGGGRHGPGLRSALGWWNVTWTTAVPVSLILMAPLVDRDMARLAVVALAPANLLCLGLLWSLPRRPGSHDHTATSDSVGREYPLLLRSARVLLPTSYLLVGALSPLMPYLLQELGVAARLGTPITAIWMVARIAVLVLLWRSKFWHGRWGTLLVAGTLLVSGFSFAIAAPGVVILSIGLVAFGLGQGIVYYAGIYYALAVGHSEVDAGGTHEGLIGVGYAVGPMAGIAAFVIADGRQGAFLMGATVLVMVLLASVIAFGPYLTARARRGAATRAPSQ